MGEAAQSDDSIGCLFEFCLNGIFHRVLSESFNRKKSLNQLVSIAEKIGVIFVEC